MKRIIIPIVFAACSWVFIGCNSDSNPDKISDSKVPAAVKTALSTKYPSAADIIWEDAHEAEKKTYKAKFKLDGKKWKAEFDEAGVFIKENEDN